MSNLSLLKKRLLYRSQHRGTRELDLLLSNYALHALPSMTYEEAEAFEALLALPENELYEWACNHLLSYTPPHS